MKNNKKVLIIEDDPSIIHVIELILSEEGYIVKSLQDTSIAIRTIKSFEPDVILLDLWMPGKNGQEIAQFIRQDVNLATLPIIILSASNDTIKVVKAIGANDYLHKPFDIIDLIEAVNRHTKEK